MHSCRTQFRPALFEPRQSLCSARSAQTGSGHSSPASGTKSPAFCSPKGTGGVRADALSVAKTTLPAQPVRRPGVFRSRQSEALATNYPLNDQGANIEDVVE